MSLLAKINRRQLVLLLLMLFIGFFFVRRFISFSLPTSALLEQRVQELQSLRSDLLVARKQSSERQEELQALQSLAEPYWFASGQRALVDQEINKEFGKLLRQAQLPATQKIDLQRNKLPGLSHIQEVQIRLELRGVSMREVSRLLQEVHGYGDKLNWSYCRIEPDNPRLPKNVNLSARLRALVLGSEAVDFLNQAPALEATGDNVKGGAAL
ncbi:MAG: hypothetical protein PHG44_10015 [Lentisphaeria bacterium]|jgi:hypothetical protein|nr:hypothetical protein [Lentisphaeria bacterium]MDY0175564.1 hypothetical protein [Lentisphaeria bacterium]